MTPPITPLDGLRVLIVEDEYMLADDLASDLARAGARVLGPVASLAAAQAMAAEGAAIDVAVLDINLRGDRVFSLAESLRARGVPIVFTTGYDAAVIPEHLRGIERCEKPMPVSEVREAVARAVAAG